MVPLDTFKLLVRSNVDAAVGVQSVPGVASAAGDSELQIGALGAVISVKSIVIVGKSIQLIPKLGVLTGANPQPTHDGSGEMPVRSRTLASVPGAKLPVDGAVVSNSPVGVACVKPRFQNKSWFAVAVTDVPPIWNVPLTNDACAPGTSKEAVTIHINNFVLLCRPNASVAASRLWDLFIITFHLRF
jgi:hypothetical protein